MLPSRAIRLDVRSFQNRKSALRGHRAAITISIRYKHSEGALTEARRNQEWIAIPRVFLSSNRCGSETLCFTCTRQLRSLKAECIHVVGALLTLDTQLGALSTDFAD